MGTIEYKRKAVFICLCQVKEIKKNKQTIGLIMSSNDACIENPFQLESFYSKRSLKQYYQVGDIGFD